MCFRSGNLDFLPVFRCFVSDLSSFFAIMLLTHLKPSRETIFQHRMCFAIHKIIPFCAQNLLLVYVLKHLHLLSRQPRVSMITATERRFEITRMSFSLINTAADTIDKNTNFYQINECCINKIL
jgi:hypothetical protein